MNTLPLSDACEKVCVFDAFGGYFFYTCPPIFASLLTDAY